MFSSDQVALKTLAIALGALLVLIQYPLWIGKGGWLRVWELDRQVTSVRQGNKQLSERNAALEGEVRDLRSGLQAVEERARYELGMVRPDETFVQFNETRPQRAAPAPQAVDVPPPRDRSGATAIRVSVPGSNR
jgi:cell division protein FtsB